MADMDRDPSTPCVQCPLGKYSHDGNWSAPQQLVTCDPCIDPGSPADTPGPDAMWYKLTANGCNQKRRVYALSEAAIAPFRPTEPAPTHPDAPTYRPAKRVNVTRVHDAVNNLTRNVRYDAVQSGEALCSNQQRCPNESSCSEAGGRWVAPEPEPEPALEVCAIPVTRTSDIDTDAFTFYPPLGPLGGDTVVMVTGQGFGSGGRFDLLSLVVYKEPYLLVRAVLKSHCPQISADRDSYSDSED
jgi:hypothetical protein